MNLAFSGGCCQRGAVTREMGESEGTHLSALTLVRERQFPDAGSPQSLLRLACGNAG